MRRIQHTRLPKPQDYPHPQSSPSQVVSPLPKHTAPSEAPSSTPLSLQKAVNLDVPFTSQAPHARWELPYKEFCEEASVLMAMRYIQNKPITSADDADAALLDIKAFEEKTLGSYLDTTAEQTATIIREHFDYDQVTVHDNPTVEDIKGALSAGKVVLMPAAGQQLGNPYFQSPGPPYHMLVIKGYTANGQFITNDPGTRRGADFLYDEPVLMNAMHDWRTDGHVEQGRKVIIIVG